MITVPLINWQPMANMPEDRKDGRRILGYSVDVEGLEDMGGFTMKWGGDGWYLDPHWYEEAPIEPTHWADINPPA